MGTLAFISTVGSTATGTRTGSKAHPAGPGLVRLQLTVASPAVPPHVHSSPTAGPDRVTPAGSGPTVTANSPTVCAPPTFTGKATISPVPGPPSVTVNTSAFLFSPSNSFPSTVSG